MIRMKSFKQTRKSRQQLQEKRTNKKAQHSKCLLLRRIRILQRPAANCADKLLLGVGALENGLSSLLPRTWILTCAYSWFRRVRGATIGCAGKVSGTSGGTREPSSRGWGNVSRGKRPRLGFANRTTNARRFGFLGLRGRDLRSLVALRRQVLSIDRCSLLG